MYGFVVMAWLVIEGQDSIPFATMEACIKARDQLVEYGVYCSTLTFCLPTGATTGQE